MGIIVLFFCYEKKVWLNDEMIKTEQELNFHRYNTWENFYNDWRIRRTI